MALLKRNAIFYKRQRFCECITMLSVLCMFTCFSLYIVFAHGFHFGKEKPFNLVHNYTRKVVKQENEDALVMCQADQHWEWCRWIHMDQFCDFEWVSSGSGIRQIGCDFPKGKVKFTGDYTKHQCGLLIRDLNAKDRGIWMCEVEKYYTGFSRRYGEYRQSIVNLVVHMKPKTTTTSSPSSSSAAAATGNPTASALTPNSFANNARGGPASGSGGASAGNGNVNNNNNSNSHNSTTVNPISAEEDFEHSFFILRMIVLGTIGCVFSILGLIFWVYFVYLWKTWDSGKREQMATVTSVEVPNSESHSGAVQKRNSSEGSIEAYPYANEDTNETIEDNDETADESPQAKSGHHPHFDRAVMRSRRKSVSFAVYKVNADTMQFDIEHKSVLLGNLSASSAPTSSIAASVAAKKAAKQPSGSPLREVAKKWRDAKTKLVLKDKLSNVILGSSGLNELDKADEKFRNRRRELMEKAKSLEEAAAAAKAKAASSAASNTASIASTTLASVSERDKTKNNEDETAI